MRARIRVDDQGRLDCRSTERRLYREDVELMAYCGNTVARKVVEWCCYKGWNYTDHAYHVQPCADAPSFSAWLSGIEMWGRMSLVRAACAAARVALEKHCQMPYGQCPCRPFKAVRAAESWVRCPCEEHQRAWHQISTGAGAQEWCPSPAFSDVRAILAADRLTGGGLAGEAICAALIGWLR